MAIVVLLFESRKNRGLYINTGYGRIYQWDCAYDHFNADPEDIRRKSRIRGTSGTYQTYCTTGKEINWLSVILGAGALILLRVAGKMIPKFPMAIVIMAAGVAATRIFHVDEYGVVLLDAVGRTSETGPFPVCGN